MNRTNGRRLDELERQAEPEKQITWHDLGNGSIEGRFDGFLLCRVRQDDPLLDDADIDIIPPEEGQR